MNGNTSLCLLLLVSGLCLFPTAAAAQPTVERGTQPFPITIQESQQLAARAISGRMYRAIEAALPELERRKMRLEDYRIFVYQLFGSSETTQAATLFVPGQQRVFEWNSAPITFT